MKYTVKQGGSFTMKVIVRNEVGNLSDVSDPRVSIYEYGKNPLFPFVDREDDAFLFEAIPVRIGLGTYEYEVTVPLDAQVGKWFALWTGELSTGSSLNMLVQFMVEPDLELGDPEAQAVNASRLLENTVYRLRLSGVLGMNGVELSETVVWFTGPYTPMCTSYNNVMTLISSYVERVEVDAINYMIWKHSLESRQMILSRKICNPDYLKLACKKYVELATARDLIAGMLSGGGPMISKALGELKVAYANNVGALMKVLGGLEDEASKWEAVLNSGGCIAYGSSLPMQVAHRSIDNADRWETGRQIREPVGSRHMANDKVITGDRTRHQHSYSRPLPLGFTGVTE